METLTNFSVMNNKKNYPKQEMLWACLLNYLRKRGFVL